MDRRRPRLLLRFGLVSLLAVVALDEDHARPVLRRPQGRHVARRPAAEHQDAGVRHAYPGATAGGWRTTGLRAAAASSRRRTGVE